MKRATSAKLSNAQCCEWRSWANVSLSERHHLPGKPGIYIVADNKDFVWYVGKANNLQSRWLGRSHHRYPQLIRSNKKLQHKIYWKAFPSTELDRREKSYIAQLKPELNGNKVKNYLPKEPQVSREIKRLIKALNRKTQLFPVLRSILAGEYTDDMGIRCVVIITNINDYSILARSAQKRYSKQVRDAWIEIETYCGQDSSIYKPLLIPAYSLQGYRFEFIAISDIIFWFEKHPEMQERWLSEVNVLGALAKALNSLEFVADLNIKTSYEYSYSTRKTLRDMAYLKHVGPRLKPISNKIELMSDPD